MRPLTKRSLARRFLPGFAVVLLFAAVCAGVVPLQAFDALDRLLYDSVLRARQASPDDRIVIVDIDERSLAEQGRWPWPRERIARLATALADDGAGVVGFDVVFAEHSRSEPGDAALEQAIRDRPILLGYYFSSDRGGRRSGVLPAPVFDRDALPPGVSVTHWDGYGANIGRFAAAARDAGFFNPMLDPDGVVRAMPLLAEYDGHLYQSLSVGLLRAWLGHGVLSLDRDSLSIDGERGHVRIPLSAGLSALAPFAGSSGGIGPEAGFRYVSATDVIEGRVDPALLRGRIVLVGTTAPGLTDLRATPVGETFPGVGIHATLIRGALNGSIDQRPPEARLVVAVAVVLFGGAMAVILPSLGPLATMAVSVAVTAAFALIYWLALRGAGLVLPASAAMAMAPVLGLYGMSVGYFVEGRARRAVLSLFGEYVSPELVRKMAADPLHYELDNSQDRDLTVMFADIRGFTRMAENMRPNELRAYLNEFLTLMTEIIHRHGGTVDKYIGDSVMAFWGAPVPDSAHADRAVDAAIEMQAGVRNLSEQFVTRGLPPLAVGIGVNSGEVTVGDMGSALRRAYTVIGDAVNLASRLEAQTKQYGVPVIVGEATVSRCQRNRFDSLDTVAVDGRAGRVRIFVPTALADVAAWPAPKALIGKGNAVQGARV